MCGGYVESSAHSVVVYVNRAAMMMGEISFRSCLLLT